MSQAPKPPENPYHLLVDKNPDMFEKALLNAVDGSRAMLNRVKDTLCRTDAGAVTDDFGVPGHNEIYKALEYYYAMRPSLDSARMGSTAARMFFEAAASNGSPNLGLDEVEEAVAHLVDIQSMDHGECVAMVSGGYDYWLKKRRIKKIYQAATSQEDWNPDDLIENARRQHSAITKNSGAPQTKFAFGAGVKAGKLHVQRFSSGIAKLDVSLGGGWGRTEAALWIAGTGAGKTVMACQQAVTLARQGLVGALITTEQPHEELEPRIISAHANIPFDRIKDGVDRNQLTHEEALRMDNLMASLETGMFIEDWMHDRSKSIGTDLDELVESYKKEHGRCDYIILDWIGGALGQMSLNNIEHIRQIYQMTADKLCDLAREHNMIVQFYAQANPVQAKNKQKIDHTMLAECKTMGRNATYILGISALEEDGCDDTKPSFKPEQFIHSSKGRKSMTYPVRVRRDFGYQRFSDWWK